ncbi:MAG: B12-binding domain-containing radical SAM protein [Proteobacteria bacterium]|nr:B12-binding domain-containing radical SAM protein [Pseudomonadota bacterium]MBU4296667.1 B12-binding domain-containing radical SAM protein [Pseudomonadota bacterium]MCG2748460.1 B12-binding domain-containing radical SAM protein [Desulfobulbaceae bacterium]
MKTLLIIPPSNSDSPLPTLGVAYLASSLQRAGHEARILDLWTEPLSDQQLLANIGEYQPDLVGITFFTRRYSATKKLADDIKDWFPDKKIVVGGYHPSALPRETLEEIQSIDFVAIGEGEETIVELLESLPDKEWDTVNGIGYRGEGGAVVLTPPRKFIKDLDQLAYPDLFQVDPRKYRIHPPYGWFGLPLTMITTRGCPGKCTFCSKSVFKRTLRSLSPRKVVDEILYWKERLPVKEIRFYDDDFTISQKRTFEICDLLIEEKVNLPWTCTTRVDFLSRDLMVRMKEAGLYFITLGVESGSPKVLKGLQKGYTVGHIRDAFSWAHQLDLVTFAFFMVGCPEETDEDVAMTMAIQKEIKPDFLNWGVLRVVPGSQLFEEFKRDHAYDFSCDQNPIYRQDLDEKYLCKLCKKGMLTHYTSPWGARAVLRYFYNTKNFGVIANGLQWIKELI